MANLGTAPETTDAANAPTVRAKQDPLRKPRKFVRLARNSRWRRALRHGVAATIEHRDVPFRNDFATVLDVGGHHGQFTLFALERFPRAKVVTFEPQASGVEKIRAVTAGESRSTIQPYALGEQPGSAELNISRQSDSSSLLPIGEAQTAAHPGTEQATTETIEVETLDNLLADPPQRPSLLKIDVQGGELAVLRGSSRTLASIDCAFVECSFVELYEGQALADEIVPFMAEHGLRLRGVFSLSHDGAGRCLQGDFLFEKGAVAAVASGAIGDHTGDHVLHAHS